jgi:hypothetical protein
MMSCGARRGVSERSMALPAEVFRVTAVPVSRHRKRMAVDRQRFEEQLRKSTRARGLLRGGCVCAPEELAEELTHRCGDEEIRSDETGHGLLLEVVASVLGGSGGWPVVDGSIALIVLPVPPAKTKGAFCSACVICCEEEAHRTRSGPPSGRMAWPGVVRKGMRA